MKELQELEKLINGGQLDEASRQLKGIRVSKDFKKAIAATIEFKRKNTQAAEVLFQEALQINPKNPIANANYASLLISQRKHKIALKYAKEAFEKTSHGEQQALAYAACLAEADRHGDAARVLAPLAENSKPSKNVLVSLASVLRANLQSSEALVILERASQLYPDEFDVERSLADVYAELDQEAALRTFRDVLAKQPDNLPIQWNSSFTELRQGNFERGWSLYDAGLTDKIGKIGRPLPYQVRQFQTITDFSKIDPAQWTLFSCEQGLGDQVLFLSAFREVIELYPKVILVGEERMLPILRRSFPAIGVYSYGFGYALGSQGVRFNGVFPIGSVMKHLRGTVDSFSKTSFPFIVPDQAKVDKYRAKFAERSGSQELIGISWSGGYWDRQRRTKSFDFESFLKLLPQGKRFVCLQYGDVANEKRIATERRVPITFIEGLDFKKDIESWIALIGACDRIISVSTAMVHFAAAMQKRVDLLLTNYQAPFVWQNGEGPSLPYPTVFRHRLGKDENFDEFILRVNPKL